MRIWSLHPRHLDRQGLTACWREALLAQAVLAGRTRGYRHHPQLERFRACPDPLAAIGAYLGAVAAEAGGRGYSFDVGRIDRAAQPVPLLDVTDGQLAYEWGHLRAKLAVRSPERLAALAGAPEPHPLFRVVPGPVAAWEVRASPG
ncbi:pyrimidine dimer DNA glycosylase/endonuclease V [Georgenia faecalis]|uniref:Pyrimidine dimer DNA glycosylase/endonuclease V n=1 Tax=Georgenia faecalis TaxID=2483799 RepID=A0ABV9D7R3_9MICO|nr:pyrimidine dimer DNA glycosylase/endonuclease V [Georgenia faecalis]